jgi:hypothetical protein
MSGPVPLARLVAAYRLFLMRTIGPEKGLPDIHQGSMSSPCSTTTEKRWRKYQVTPMRNGLWRAECYQEDCGWFHDLPGEEGAVTRVTAHAARHELSFRRARANRTTGEVLTA